NGTDNWEEDDDEWRVSVVADDDDDTDHTADNWDDDDDDICFSGCWICERCSLHTFRFESKILIPIERHSNSDPSHVSIATVSLLASFTTRPHRPVLMDRASVGKDNITFSKKLLIPPGDPHYVAYLINNRYALYNEDTPTVSTSEVPQHLLQRLFPDSMTRPLRVNTYITTTQQQSTSSSSSDVVRQQQQQHSITPSLSQTMLQPLHAHQNEMDKAFQDDISRLPIAQLSSVAEENDLLKILRPRYSVIVDLWALLVGRSSNKQIVKPTDVLTLLLLLDKPQMMSGTNDFTGIDSTVIAQCLDQVMSSSSNDADDYLSRRTLGGDKDGVRSRVEGKNEMMEYNVMTMRHTSSRSSSSTTTSFTRTKLIESIIRLAIVIGKTEELSVDKSFARFVDYYIEPKVLYTTGLTPFPRRLVQSDEIEKVCIDYLQLIRRLRNRYGGCPEQFVALPQLLRLIGKNFTSKDARSIFILSKGPAVDNSRQSLTYAQFIEALCRLAVVLWNQRSSSSAAAAAVKRDTKHTYATADKVGD
ncbi:hypothetical protein FOZ62_029056, partial [Perkinsus olseni]